MLLQDHVLPFFHLGSILGIENDPLSSVKRLGRVRRVFQNRHEFRPVAWSLWFCGFCGKVFGKAVTSPITDAAADPVINDVGADLHAKSGEGGDRRVNRNIETS